MEQAQRQVDEARSLLKEGKYEEAASELRLALYDMDASIKVLEAPVTDIDNYPDVVRDIVNAEQYPDLLYWMEDWWGPTIHKAIDLVIEEQARLSAALMLIEQGDYKEASTALDAADKSLSATVRAVRNTVGVIERRTRTFPDIAMSVVFLDSAKKNIGKSQAIIEQGDFDELNFIETLRMAYHDIEMSYAILSNNELIVEHGLSLKDVQSNRLNLEKAIINLQNSREEYLRTVILAPFAGMVVDVGVSEDDQLSQQDYSSKAAVHLVDTSTVKFDGTVDEVDIFQVEVGQQANILIDALLEADITGIVTFISPAGADESGVVNYTVTIELDPTEVELKGTLTATADIIIEESKNVLLIPTNALNSAPNGDFVEVVIDDATMQTEQRPVELGIRSYQFAEVISGLEEGEKILVSN
jgi:RND family efflux transporter MFP subunit